MSSTKAAVERAAAPQPTVMPVDRREWRKELHFSNFVNTWAQYRDLQSLPAVKSVLIVGPGQGFEAAVLGWRSYVITTFDIDPEFEPDVLGSVHDMSMFEEGRFDAVIASHVLEHLAVDYLDPALGELARVARHALIYLPVRGRHAQLRIRPGFRDLDFSFILDAFNYFERPDGRTPRYMEGQHFWEIGMRGFRLRDIRRRLSRHFDILHDYRNADWLPSHNFVLRSRLAVARSAGCG
jgi:hypothetical protein